MKFSVFLLLALQLATLARSATLKSTLSCALGLSKTYKLDDSVAEMFVPYLENKYNTTDYVIVKLFTRENKNGEIINLNDDEGLHKSSFNFNRPTKIITHGYWNSGNSPSCTLMQDAFLARGDYNIIVVDWWCMQSVSLFKCSFSSYRVLLPYGKVVQYVPQVSQFVTSMLEFLENNGLNLKTTTLIGHSLGAHVMGTASHRMKNKVNYIVGLDPALPKFEQAEPGTRLSTEDATTVEVIHTNEGHCGFKKEIGHFDFYPNGGSKQPGCLTNQCAHGRSYEFYAESISSKDGFFGHRCSDFTQVKDGNCTGDLAKMGGLKGWQVRFLRSTTENFGGLYHVETNDKPPYAMGK